MFRISHAHHQKDYIVHVAVYGMFSTSLCKQSGKLTNVLDTEPGKLLAYTHGKHTTYGCMYNRVYLIMNIRCAKYVGNKKNLIEAKI
jgi:hypothetical protein